MSWSYSRALAAEFSEACCLDTALFAQLSMTHTPDQYYSHGKTTEHSRLSRFGMTCAPLTDDRGEALLMWFLAASRARTSALRGGAPDWTARGQGYGEKWRGLLARFDPATSSLRTAQLSLVEDLAGFSPTLPRWGLMLDGDVYPQPIPALTTAEIESGFWPTTTCDSATERTGRYAQGGMPLTAAARVSIPTPTVCGNYNRKGASSTSGDGLATFAKKYPTPCASASKGSSPNALTRQDGKDRTNDRLDHFVMSLDGGQLNPEWVEWLMGWPIGHTGLKPLGTGRFQEFVQQHGESFTDDEEAA